MDIKWVDGFEIRIGIDGGATLISANREGLLSLAEQLRKHDLGQDQSREVHDGYISADGPVP